MKYTDFTLLGGLPTTQDLWAWLQTEFTEMLPALAQTAGSDPVAIYGCGITNVSSTYTLAAGWLFFNGQLVRVPGNPVTLSGGNSLYVQLQPSSTDLPLPWNNGSIPNILQDVTGVLIQQATGTADTGTTFLASELLNYGVRLGLQYRESAWQHMVVNTGAGNGTITGNIYYKKDTIANTLQLRCNDLIVSTPNDFIADPYGGGGAPLGTLSAGWRPTNDAPFAAWTPGGFNMIAATAGYNTDHVRVKIVGGSGIIDFIGIKQTAGNYPLEFNVVIPMD